VNGLDKRCEIGRVEIGRLFDDLGPMDSDFCRGGLV
jgi:hypothetical protein